MKRKADESIYWLELMEAADLADQNKIAVLKKEANELTAIFTAIGKTAKQNQKSQNNSQ